MVYTAINVAHDRRHENLTPSFQSDFSNFLRNSEKTVLMGLNITIQQAVYSPYTGIVVAFFVVLYYVSLLQGTVYGLFPRVGHALLERRAVHIVIAEAYDKVFIIILKCCGPNIH